ncbi:MAG TPA: OmpA family protein [Chitinophagaceae bacterium]|nr:OmpA family protein [Chitinophagaceae bacterium]
MKSITIVLAGMLLLASCVPAKQLKQSQAETAALRADSTRLANRVTDLESNIAQLKNNISQLKDQVAKLSEQNSKLGEQSASQQNQLDQSKMTLQQQQQRLQQLQNLLAQQRAKSEELKNKMIDALRGFSSSDLSVTQKNGKVYVSLSENLLFPSGSATVNPKGVDALSKLAAVLNVNPDISVDIEGHTDSIPIHGRYQDNWDLSTARANAIVRILVNNYKVDPVRVESLGHSWYDPVDTNATPEGRARNRRTEIILSPKLDELYKIIGS